MPSEPLLFPQIKKLVHEIVPDAKVLLFGSQAAGTATEESDWDVLVLTKEEVDREFKETLWNHVYPLSVKAGTIISLLIVHEWGWNNSPVYYALQKNVESGPVIS